MKSALSSQYYFRLKSPTREGECLAEQGTASIHPSVCRGGGISETGCPLEMPHCLRPKLSIPNPEDYYFPVRFTVIPPFPNARKYQSFQLKHR